MKIGIVGMGGFGKLHYDTLRSIEGVKVSSLCDKDKKRLENFSEAVYDDYDDLLSSDIDCVDIVVDEQLHFEFARKAILAGKHVFLEKPIALSSSEAQELKTLAESNSVVLVVGLILRFDPRHAFVFERIRSGDLGDIRHIYCRRNFTLSGHDKYGRVNPFFTAAIHDIDQIIWMSGSKVKKVAACARYHYKREHPDAIAAMLELDNCATATIENIWHLPHNNPYGFEFQLEIIGSRETARIANQPDVELWSSSNRIRHKELEIETELPVQYPELFFSNNVHGRSGGALRNELEHFIDCVRKNEQSSIIRLDEVVYGIKVAEMCIAASCSDFKCDDPKK